MSKASKAAGSVVPRPTGRPSLRTPEIVDYILERVAKGEFLTRICAPDDMPDDKTFRLWVSKDEELSSRFTDARARGHDEILHSTFDIADDTSNDYIETENGPRLNAEHVQRSKLRIETRLKALAILDPKRFGNKVEISGGEDIGANALAKVVDPLNAICALMGDGK